ncbi:MarR family winged helix-turn-helix transcriptional regulator [Crocinitomix sp.]|nr:MarR family winged helix-turn-helix transcriptional regulator [Crocinitomix sp.]
MDSTLIQVIKHYERYKTAHSSDREQDNLSKFVAYLNEKVGEESDLLEAVTVDNWSNYNRKTLLEMTTSYIGKMSRYLDNYCRKNLSETPIGSIEEFTYLIVCMEPGQLSKTELIQKNGHPITTGTDIIKRLINKGHLRELPHPTDKRSICVEITDLGKGAIYQSSGTLNKLSAIGAGILSNKELIALVRMLQKLDDFHDKVQKNHKDMNLDAILEDTNDAITA